MTQFQPNLQQDLLYNCCKLLSQRKTSLFIGLIGLKSPDVVQLAFSAVLARIFSGK